MTTHDSPDLPERGEMARLRPGDRVLIHMHDQTTQADADKVIEALNDRFPGIEFTYVIDVRRVVIMPAELD
jgi:hypothetical protein